MDDFIEYDISQACKEITKLCQMSMAELTVLGQDYSGMPICPLLKRFREITVLLEKHPGYVPADINELIEVKRAEMDKENRDWYAQNMPEIFAQVEKWNG